MNRVRIRNPVGIQTQSRIRFGIKPMPIHYAAAFYNAVLRIRDVLSRIPDHDFYPFRIPNPKTATKERGGKKFVVKPFFVATNFTKLKVILFFQMLKKKFWASFQRIIEFFTPKFVTKP
jgi:hypothetical protein